MKGILGREIPNNIRVVVRRDVLAETLWESGEDVLAEYCLELSDEDLHHIHRLAVWHEVNDPEPDDGPKLTRGRMLARANSCRKEKQDPRRISADIGRSRSTTG